jgi:hypothetical protein
MTESPINHQQRLAIVERVACHTVGIAVENNTAVGTGTLISSGQEHLVVTAEHVIKGVDVGNIRFWCRPPAPIVEKAAKDLTQSEIGRLTRGQVFPIEAIVTDSKADLAAIKIANDFKLPEPNQFYQLDESRPFIGWPEDEIEGLSMVYFGFPIGNSLQLGAVNDRAFHFVGCAHGICDYDRKLNADEWKNLPSSIFPDKDFLIKYNLSQENIAPYGFSGCGVWVGSVSPSSLIWSSDPVLLGTIHTYFPKKSLLVAAKVRKVFGITQYVAQIEKQKRD